MDVDFAFSDAAKSDCRFDLCRKASFSKLLSTNATSRDKSGMYHGDNADTLKRKEKMWKLMETYIPTDSNSIQRSIVNHVEYTLARTRFSFGPEDCYRATAFSVRDRLIETLNDTVTHVFTEDVKRCYYLSLEFLLGRAMQNALVNLDIENEYKNALLDLGYNLEELYDYEHDPALGNGGLGKSVKKIFFLGRLAACFLDSMSTLALPCTGYGIRYTYGIFEQKIVNGRQVEYPDYWLIHDNPWEICRQDITYAVRFYGEVKTEIDHKTNKKKYKWTGGTIVQAVAYDNPVPGFDTYNCNNLRLWKATPAREFDFHSFNEGRYLESVEERQNAEAISAVLYPNDNTMKGKILRLKQQYFFCCATIQDVLRRFKRQKTHKWSDLPSKIALQLNDTHPTIAIPEFVRILVDVENMEFSEAWDIAKQIFNYTNHTVLPEALEKWPVELIENLLPRHLLIINDINFSFLTEVRQLWPENNQQVQEKICRMSIYEEGWPKMIRMSNLAVIGSNKVNGVAAIHSDIIKKQLFKDFVDFYSAKGNKNKFINITNGVTTRRWIHCCNRRLSNIMSEWIGSDNWLTDHKEVTALLKFVDNKELQKSWREVKLFNKKILEKWVLENCNVQINSETMLFDIQVKRIHEYKRQLLNVLYIIHRYLKIKKILNDKSNTFIQPRACMIGGKAAPGYHCAKLIIKLTNCVADIVNNDQQVSEYLKVAFLPNYKVSSAMIIIPASDISHQISTAGTEASGTSNMKFVMNGGLLLGTLDGANVEIREECGEETMFLFGLREHEIEKARNEARNGNYHIDSRLHEVFDYIHSGCLTRGDRDAQRDFDELIGRLKNNGNGHNGDFYLLCRDFPDFCRAQELVDETYKNQTLWTELCIKMGKFSSDRTVKQYADEIWQIKPCERNHPDDIKK